MAIRVQTICRYPVKGLSAEYLRQVELEPYCCIAHDRRFALALPSTQFDPAAPRWLAKTHFLMLMRDEKLAELHTRFDPESGYLCAEHQGREVLRQPLEEPAGRAATEAFFERFMAGVGPVAGRPRLVEAPGHTFSDAKQKPNARGYHYLSIINLASIAALEAYAGAPIDPIRFRANFYVDGLAAWSELNWIDDEIGLGGARLHVVSPITRCPATMVNPATARRDLDVPALLKSGFGHVIMGIYAEVSSGGAVALESELLAPTAAARSKSNLKAL